MSYILPELISACDVCDNPTFEAKELVTSTLSSLLNVLKSYKNIESQKAFLLSFLNS